MLHYNLSILRKEILSNTVQTIRNPPYLYCMKTFSCVQHNPQPLLFYAETEKYKDPIFVTTKEWG